MRRSAPNRLQARGALRVCARAGTQVIGHDGYPGHGSPRTAAPGRPTRTTPGAVVTESHPPTESRPSPGQPRDVPPPPEPGGDPASVVSVEGRGARSQCRETSHIPWKLALSHPATAPTALFAIAGGAKSGMRGAPD